MDPVTGEKEVSEIAHFNDQVKESVNDALTNEADDHKRVSVIIPTLNAGPEFVRSLEALTSQTPAVQEIIVIDSGSSDDTCENARSYGCRVHEIARTSFGHGETRNLGASMAQGNIFVFMTQDAIPADDSALDKLVRMLFEENCAVAYGRQLPRPDAGFMARHARLFNYPQVSRVKTKKDIGRLGIKTPFCSNCFAAYRRSIFENMGGFSSGLIFGEDMEFAARAIRDGQAIAYAGHACVYHSHDYRLAQEFRRAFDIGVFHAQTPWIRSYFGNAGNEGVRFVVSELGYLKNHAPASLVRSLVTNAAKILGYKLGARHGHVSRKWKMRMSMNKYFWQNG